MNLKYTRDAWLLFHRMFKNDEDIVVIDDYDRVYWGKILVEKIDPDCGFHLKRINGKGKFFYWHEIRYMGQDGFPLRKLKGADGSDLIENEPSVEKELRKQINESKPGFLAIFGDPFMVENCSVELFNSGKYGMQYHLKDEEECLVLKADNGSVAQLYNLPYIYHMEFLK